MINTRFGKWTIIAKVGRDKSRRQLFLCRCDCGTEKIHILYTLKNLSHQCHFCRNKDMSERIGKKNLSYRHGMTHTNIYRIWSGIISRCYNSKVKIYKYYGGRGIKVCDSWLDFMNFYKDMSDRPKKMQIDRIDNNGNYEPNNCKWVTARENNPYLKGDVPDNMPGKRFGKWVVIEKVCHKPGHRYYKCRCDCGTEKIICGGDLRRKSTTQCLKCKNKEHGIKHKGWNERIKRRNKN